MEHLDLALTQIGVKEIIGIGDNEQIIKYFDDIGFDGKGLKDETAWCSAFVNWICFKHNLCMSGKLNARSWLTVGQAVEPNDQKLGDIVIFWRVSRSSWKGHVAFFIAKRDGYIYVLGGNQGNQVSIRAYTEDRLLSYRRVT